MKTEIGEFVVGAYLKHVLKCDFVNYNVRPPGGGLEGLGELDVVGFRFSDRTAFVCEVTTHLGGLIYGSADTTAKKIRAKCLRQQQYAKKHLTAFKKFRFMLWSPIVGKSLLTKTLAGIPDLELVVNGDYSKRINELREIARKTKSDTGNPFFRTLQILEHMRHLPVNA